MVTFPFGLSVSKSWRCQNDNAIGTVISDTLRKQTLVSWTRVRKVLVSDIARTAHLKFNH